MIPFKASRDGSGTCRLSRKGTARHGLQLKLSGFQNIISEKDLVEDPRHHILLSTVCIFYIENDAEIFPAHYTWKLAEKGFKMVFMINKLGND